MVQTAEVLNYQCVQVPVANSAESLQSLTGFQVERFTGSKISDEMSVSAKSFRKPVFNQDQHFVFDSDGTGEMPLLLERIRPTTTLADNTEYLIGIFGMVTLAQYRDGVMRLKAPEFETPLSDELYTVLACVVGAVLH